MTDEFTWYITRTSGILSWVLLALATLWGLLLASRLLERRPSPAWLLDLHRHLGNLTLTLTAVHVSAIVIDDFVDYTIVEALVPFASDADKFSVAFGVLALHLLVIVQGSSLLRGRLRVDRWRRLHYLSAPLFVLATVHGWLIGTDITNPIVAIVAIVLLAEVALVLALRVGFGRRPIPTLVSPRHEQQRPDREPDTHQL